LLILKKKRQTLAWGIFREKKIQYEKPIFYQLQTKVEKTETV
jgi:hypothetical protein